MYLATRGPPGAAPCVTLNPHSRLLPQTKRLIHEVSSSAYLFYLKRGPGHFFVRIYTQAGAHAGTNNMPNP